MRAAIVFAILSAMLVGVGYGIHRFIDAVLETWRESERHEVVAGLTLGAQDLDRSLGDTPGCIVYPDGGEMFCNVPATTMRVCEKSMAGMGLHPVLMGDVEVVVGGPECLGP